MAKKFKFRLQSVLDFRAVAEEESKKVFLDASAARIAKESERGGLQNRRAKLLEQPTTSLHDRITLENALDRIQDEENELEIMIQVLANEEESARLRWLEAKKELQAMEKLLEIEREAYIYEENRKEQIALDEWTTTRRSQ